MAEFFLLKMTTDWKNIVLFRIKSALTCKKEFESKPFYMNIFFKTKIKSYGYELEIFLIKNVLSVVLIILV